MERFIPTVSYEEIKKERQRARVLKKTSWWKNKISKGRCYYCGRIIPPSQLTMDHIIPLIRGGKSTKSNIVPSCKECNNKKKYLIPIEWETYLERLNFSDPDEIL